MKDRKAIEKELALVEKVQKHTGRCLEECDYHDCVKRSRTSALIDALNWVLDHDLAAGISDEIQIISGPHATCIKAVVGITERRKKERREEGE